VKNLVSLVLLISLIVGCESANETATRPNGESDSASVSYPIQTVATVGMVADIVRNVGGDHVTVTQIMGSGVDPHLYKPTSDDVKTILDADIVFYSGLMLEGKMADTLVKVARKKPVYAVTELVEEDQLFEPEEMEGHYDPHVWMDVSLWVRCVDVVSKSLQEFDSQHAEEYQRNAAKYKEVLTKLHEYGVTCSDSIPKESRVLITSHDAFNYFGRAYHLDVQGVQGLSTESEAGLQRVNQLVDLIVDRQVKAVFIESSVPRKNIDALIEGAKARGHNTIVGGELFSDAMGQAGSYEGTYVGMLDHNLTVVTLALGGEAPKNGMQGKLGTNLEQ